MYHHYHRYLFCDHRTQRDFLGELLEDLLEAFKAINLLKGKAKIIDARVPIIKCTLDFGQFLTIANSVAVLSGVCALYCHDLANMFFVNKHRQFELLVMLSSFSRKSYPCYHYWCHPSRCGTMANL